MARRWSIEEERIKKKELLNLYVKQNKTIKEIGVILTLAENSVYDRIVRLGIPTRRNEKERYNNRNPNIKIPQKMTAELAEFIGIMLGDGHLTPTQVTVTLGTKEQEYATYISALMEGLFGVKPKVTLTKNGCLTVYLGSTVLARWLLHFYGLVYNKVQSQVDIPRQCFLRPLYMRRVIRGLLDTDGSVYRLRSGIQISFTNMSKPLLRSAKDTLEQLGFHPSAVSHNKIYLTRKVDIVKYIAEIGFSNSRHIQRLISFQAQ